MVRSSPSVCALLGCALSLAFVLPARLSAQASRATVRGRVVERESGAPVAGTEVRVAGSPATATADAEGRWALPALAAGRYTLRVRRIGYAPLAVSLELAARDTTLELRLDPSALRLDEMVVTAARREQRLADVAVPTEVITRRAIEETGAADLAAVLTERTGVQFDGGHPAGSGVMLQGLSNERVLVLLDGQPLYGRISGTLDLARIPTAVVDRVEIVKGPQAALYGSEAMGGVVNIVTRAPGGAGLDGGARITAGSGGRREGGGSAGVRSGAVAALVDVGRREIERASGRPGETGALAERLDAMARASWRPDSALTVEASALVLDERQRWPSGTRFEFADNTQVSARLGADWRSGRHRLRPTLYLSRYDHLSRQSSVNLPIAGTGDRQIQRLVEAELLYGGAVMGQALDAGVELKQERISSTDGRIGGGARTLYSVEPYAQLDWSSDRWSVVPGLRLTWNQTWGSTLTPRLALRYRVTDALSLRGAVGRGYRAPDFKELYLEFLNDAAGYAVYGTPGLRPEHSTNLSGGVEWSGTRLYTRAQLFWNDLRDFIETRARPGDGSGLLLFEYANVARGRTYGAEWEGGLLLPGARIEAGYAYLGTEDGATGKPLLGRAVHSARLTTSVTPSAGLRATVSTLYTGPTPMERDESGRITSRREPFLRFDARVAQRLPWGLEIAVGADNLLDRQPAGWADAVGREWYLGLTWLSNSASRE